MLEIVRRQIAMHFVYGYHIQEQVAWLHRYTVTHLHYHAVAQADQFVSRHALWMPRETDDKMYNIL